MDQISTDEPDSRWIQEAVSEFEGPLCRYALRFSGNLEQARDAVQETFLRLLKEEREKVESRLGPWLFAVCRTRCLDLQRKEHRMVPLTDEGVIQDNASSPAQAAEKKESHQTAYALLGTLPDNQQEVIRLKFQEGMSYRDISQVTQLSESNVGYLIHMGLKSIRGQLGIA